ncbi:MULTISPECIES: hypothetical protein [unclassified Microcoleus]|uniref:hypothetical protein n=1 Tax=unclassified Microcoleus TaxID=2642155 RepID=UPI002FD2C2E3
MEQLLTVPLAELPLLGSKKQIGKYLANLKLMYCVWEEDDKYYPLKSGLIRNPLRCDIDYKLQSEKSDNNSDEFAYYLTNVGYIPPQVFREDEMQLHFWDSLLRVCAIVID